MSYMYNTKVEGNLLTVNVVLPKMEKGERYYKVDSASILNELKDKFDIISCLEKNTFIPSFESDVSGSIVFKIRIPKTKVSRGRNKKETNTNLGINSQTEEN